MDESNGLLWIKLLGLLVAGAAFVVWQWRDLRNARVHSLKDRSQGPKD